MNAIIPFKPLNARQQEFVRLYVNSGDAHQSALLAGYAPATSRVATTQIFEMPAVALAIVQAARLRLVRATPMALGTLEHLAEKAVSEKVRLEAAKTLLDRAGITAVLPEKERNPIDVPLHEMSLADLQKKVGQYEIELGNRARDVTPGTITDLTELTEEAT